MACLNCCLPDVGDNFTEEPLIDLVEVIRQCALQQLRLQRPAQLTWWEHLCPLQKIIKLEVDQSFLDIQPTSEMKFLEKDYGIQSKQKPSMMVLFRSRYQNNTEQTQAHSFVTSRETVSALELSMQCGFTLGQTLELGLNLPTAGPDCELFGKLGGHLQWSFERGKVKREEDVMTWSVNSEILVSAKQECKVSLKVSEKQWISKFVLPCKILPRTESGTIPVFVRRKRNNYLLLVVKVPCKDVVKMAGGFLTLAGQGEDEMTCELHGTCHVMTAINQEICLSEPTMLVPAQIMEAPCP